MVGPAVIAQQLPREHHVVGGDGTGRRKMPRAGLSAKVTKLRAASVSTDFGQQAIQRERLVIAARHQALDHVAADIRRREPFDDQRIEAVEGAENALHQPAAFGRVRIDVGKRRKIRRQGRFAMHGDGMARLGGR